MIEYATEAKRIAITVHQSTRSTSMLTTQWIVVLNDHGAGNIPTIFAHRINHWLNPLSFNADIGIEQYENVRINVCQCTIVTLCKPEVFSKFEDLNTISELFVDP